MDLEDRFRVRPKGFGLDAHDTGDTAGFEKKSSAGRRDEDLARLDELQERPYAEYRHLQPLALRGGDRGACASRVPRRAGGRAVARAVEGALRGHHDVGAARLLARAEDPAKNWKFSPADVEERERWDDCQAAYEAALKNTSTEHSPWYVIPADHKWFMRIAVAAILVHHLEDMDPRFPQPTGDDRAAMDEAVEKLRSQATGRWRP
jgi:hypothetical protein